MTSTKLDANKTKFSKQLFDPSPINNNKNQFLKNTHLKFNGMGLVTTNDARAPIWYFF